MGYRCPKFIKYFLGTVKHHADRQSRHRGVQKLVAIKLHLLLNFFQPRFDFLQDTLVLQNLTQLRDFFEDLLASASAEGLADPPLVFGFYRFDLGENTDDGIAECGECGILNKALAIGLLAKVTASAGLQLESPKHLVVACSGTRRVHSPQIKIEP